MWTILMPWGERWQNCELVSRADCALLLRMAGAKPMTETTWMQLVSRADCALLLRMAGAKPVTETTWMLVAQHSDYGVYAYLVRIVPLPHTHYA